MTRPTVTVNTVVTWVKDVEATAGSCEKTRRLSTSTAGETSVRDRERGEAADPHPLDVRIYEFQPTHLGNAKGDEIRLRQHGPLWDVQSRR